MNLRTYETDGRALYGRLAELVAGALNALIRQQAGLRLQHIQHRAKEPSSLKKKLERAGALESDDIAAAAKDLAGCRAVLYTNSDVARFQSSGIITDNFVVDWARTKIHHPHPALADPNLFISNNYVIRLRDERLALAEYAAFRDIWCELQVQTTLNHAWSEMEHDMIYKTPTLNGFGGALMQGIEKRMKKIMRDYLLPAGYEFQKVVDDFERLSSGKQLFDAGALRQLASCEDNNARYELLHRFKEYVLPSYDDLRKVQAEVREAVVAAVLRAYVTEPRPIETPFASLPGESVETVLKVAADILDYLRYFDVESTFDAICILFAGAPNDQVRKRLLSSAETLAKHQLDIWKEAGPVVQLRLVEHVQRMTPQEIVPARPVVMKVLGEVLKSELTGSSATYNAVTLHRGAAVPNDALEIARKGAINLMKGFFRAADSEGDRLWVVQTLARAMQPPYRGVSDALAKMILRDTVEIVDFYTEIAPQQSYELLEHLEHSLLWQYRHKGKSGAKEEDRDLVALRVALTERIFAFRDAINADGDFVIFKTLVGFESVFAPEWEADALDVEARAVYQTACIKDLVAEVTKGSADKWLSILSRCARADLKDGATFISFNRFLEELGKSKPAVVMSYLDRLDDRLAIFLPAILGGLELGVGPESLHKKLRRWIEDHRYVSQILWYQRYAAEVDPQLLESALHAAVEAQDDAAILKAIAVSVTRHNDVDGGLLSRVFLPALRYLNERGDSRWVHEAAVLSSKSSLFQDLSPEQVDLVLTSLHARTHLEHRDEEILNEIASGHPTTVVDFFGQRIAAERNGIDGDHFEAIPYEFYLLQPALQKIPEYAVAAARKWFAEDSEHFMYRGGRLLANVFPEFTQEYERALQLVFDNSARDDFRFLAQVLTNYNGQARTHHLTKQIVDTLPANDPILQHIGIALDSTGSLRGEFGLVEAYRVKRDEMELWLTDSRERVREFAGRHIHHLDLQISAEQRRSEEELEFRKRSYPSPDQSEGR
jgi:ppGpp synthetase/RelA/SpoT-type nucleotidyltranferase